LNELHCPHIGRGKTQDGPTELGKPCAAHVPHKTQHGPVAKLPSPRSLYPSTTHPQQPWCKTRPFTNTRLTDGFGR